MSDTNIKLEGVSRVRSSRLVRRGRANATQAGILAAAEWINWCKNNGWSEETLLPLESLWWKHHDENGKLKAPNAALCDPAHGLSWSVCHPTDTTTATQLRLGQYDVLGLYWHLDTGNHRTGGRKVHTTEKDLRMAIVRRNIQKRQSELELLAAELVRLNARGEQQPSGE